MKTTTTSWVIVWTVLALGGTAAAGNDKTLVSWVCLANTTQRGGSALTVQRDGEFDGIVFGEGGQMEVKEVRSWRMTPANDQPRP